MECDVNSLLAQASAFKNAAFAQSTIRTYKSQSNCYFKFCLNYNLQPIPASQQTLCSYIAFLTESHSPSSIKGYLNAVRLLHLEGGFANPLIDNWEIKMIQKGISRLYGSPPKQKLPITIPILLGIFKSLNDSTPDRAFWASCLIAFYGFLRKSTLLPSTLELTKGKYISRFDIIDLNLFLFYTNPIQ